MKYRALSPKLSSAPTNYGRKRLRSLAASHRWLTQKIRESEVRLFLLEAQRQVELARTGLSCTICREKPPKSPLILDTPSFEATASFRSSDRESPTS